ncbi:unnamed protein product [Thelazia callipaeda]|uniref:Vitellogenin domain-containing protein n=1 Tax=Thelazia callipaeda TaxID=103827 RepID=A0A0N5D3T9_THECL|nr:unnamed protein product [Thelazia callipaeda]
MNLLSHTSINGINVGRDWSYALEKFPLLFTFDNGKIKTLCVHEAELTWALNIKRGVLSAFQIFFAILHENSLVRSDEGRETDISGDCPVLVDKNKRSGFLNLKTTKNLNACYRENDMNGIRTVPYRFQSVFCTETYMMEAGLGNNSLFTLHTDQTLQIAGIASALTKPIFNKHSSIFFDHSDDELKLQTSPHFASQLLHELCQQVDRVNLNAASKFANLIYHLRALSHHQLLSISNVKCDAFIEALAACASHACLKKLTNLINLQYAPESLYLSLALQPNPKLSTLNFIAEFIESIPIHGRNDFLHFNASLLSVTSLVQSYCLMHSTCGKEPTVQRIVQSILSRLPSNCNTAQEFGEIKKTVVILKAIGNIADEEHSLSTLSNCIANGRISKIIRLAAIDALRRKPCSDRRNAEIITLFFNQKENVRIRIQAFRQLMECPNIEILENIEKALLNETVNQVKSYVWSYLKAKQESSNPGFHNLQRILKRLHLSERYNLNPYRFSRYSEIGYYNQSTNYGGHVDMSVIFEPDRYIPCEINFNFTLHSAGISMNIFEIGVQSEGLEKANEELFGPDGYFTNPNGHVFREKKFQSLYPRLNHLKQLYAYKHQSSDNQIKAALHIRMFGDDLHYYSIERDDFMNVIKDNIELDKVLSRMAQETVKKISRHTLMFELWRTFPILSGLSFQISGNMSLVTKFDSKLKLNLIDLLHQKSNAESFLDLRPSLSLSREARLVLRAGHVTSGTLISSNLYAATSIIRSMKMTGGQIFSLKIDTPHHDILIAKIHTDVIRIENNRYHPSLISIRKPKERGMNWMHRCTGETVAKFLGIKACIQKDERKLLISVDTPGSEINRKIEADFELSFPRKRFRFGIISPFKTFLLDGNLQEVRYLHDYVSRFKVVLDRQEYHLDGTLKANKMGSRNTYSLRARSVAESLNDAEVVAEVQYSTTKPFVSVDFTLSKVSSKPVIIKILMNPNAPNYEGKLEYSGIDFNGKLHALLINQKMLDLKGTIHGEYQWANYAKQSFQVGLEQQFKEGKHSHYFKHNAHILGTTFSQIEYYILSNRSGNSIHAGFGTNYLGQKSSAAVHMIREPNDLYNINYNVKCDQFGIDLATKIIYQNQFPRQFLLQFDTQTSTIQNLHASAKYITKASLSLSYIVSPKWNFNGDIKLSYPGREIAFRNEIDETFHGKYKMETHLQWDSNSRIDAISDITFQPQEHEYAIHSTATISGLPEPISINKQLKYHNDSYSLPWQSEQGHTTIYDVRGIFRGRFGQQQKLDVSLKLEKFGLEINYHIMAEIQPHMDTIKTHATIFKDGYYLGTGDIIFPKNYKFSNQRYRGAFLWNHQNQSRKLALEYNRQKHLHGLLHALSMESDDDTSLNVEFDHHHNRISLKCNFDKNNIRTISTELLATTLKWDSFEFIGQLYTDEPLQRQLLKTLVAYNYKMNEINVKGLFEMNSRKYLIQANWHNNQRNTYKHYSYSGKIEIPQKSINFNQELEVKNVTKVWKVNTSLEIIIIGKTYNLNNVIRSDDRSISVVSDLMGNDNVVKYIIEYYHNHGDRKLKKHLTYNGKTINFNLATICHDDRVKIDAAVASTFEVLRIGKAMFHCQKGPIFWNCEVEGNINNRYVIKGHESLDFINTDIGYEVMLGHYKNGEGNVKFIIDHVSILSLINLQLFL